MLYEGITFRSVLEVRWAVFFDALGITWEYEPRHDFGGLAYLPDFWLPTHKTYIEIKPCSPFEGIEKCAALAKQWPITVFCGPSPQPNPRRALTAIDGALIDSTACEWGVCRECYSVIFSAMFHKPEGVWRADVVSPKNGCLHHNIRPFALRTADDDELVALATFKLQRAFEASQDTKHIHTEGVRFDR